MKFAHSILEESRNKFPQAQLFVPKEIRLVSEELVWNTKGVFSKAQSQSNLLVDFIKLADSNPEDILVFAQKWGVLGLCQHSLPSSHRLPTSLEEWNSPPDPDRFCEPKGVEPLIEWRSWARKYRAVLNITWNLNLDKTGDEKDWELLYEDAAYKDDYDVIVSLQADSRGLFEKILIQDVVNNYLFIGDVRPSLVLVEFEYAEVQPRIDLGNHGIYRLFGALAVQLMVAVSQTEGFALCSGCGTAYFPKRRPRAGEGHYCEDCGRKVALRNAAKRYRQNRKLPPSERNYRQIHKRREEKGNVKARTK